MLNFVFLEKGLELVSPPHFVYDFQGKCFSCLLTDLISLPGCLYFLKYWSIFVLQLFVNLLSTNFQLSDVFLDMTLLYYNPNFFEKYYFALSCSNPPVHRI